MGRALSDRLDSQRSRPKKTRKQKKPPKLSKGEKMKNRKKLQRVLKRHPKTSAPSKYPDARSWNGRVIDSVQLNNKEPYWSQKQYIALYNKARYWAQVLKCDAKVFVQKFYRRPPRAYLMIRPTIIAEPKPTTQPTEQNTEMLELEQQLTNLQKNLEALLIECEKMAELGKQLADLANSTKPTHKRTHLDDLIDEIERDITARRLADAMRDAWDKREQERPTPRRWD